MGKTTAIKELLPPSGVKSCKLVAIEFIFHSFMWARVWAPVSLLLLCLINLRGAQKHSNSNPHETQSSARLENFLPMFSTGCSFLFFSEQSLLLFMLPSLFPLSLNTNEKSKGKPN